MSKSQSWFVALALSALAAGLSNLAHAIEAGGALSAHDWLVAGQTAAAFLAGAIMRSPNDAAKP